MRHYTISAVRLVVFKIKKQRIEPPWRGISCEELLDYIAKDNPIILEVGAADGSSTQDFLDTFPDCRVYAFEPDERMLKIHRATVKSERVTLYKMALGNEDGKAAFYFSDFVETGRAINRPYPGLRLISLKKPTKHWKTMFPHVQFRESCMVDCAKLDTWVNSSDLKAEIIDLIWADVNGGEEELIRGGREVLKKTRYLYTEFNSKEVDLYENQPSLQQILEMLPNFKVVKLFKSDALLENKSLNLHTHPKR